MLDRLVASRPDRGRSGTYVSAVVAVLLHGGLVTVGVVATLPAPRPDPPHVVSLPEFPYVVEPRSGADAGGSLPPPLPWPDPELRDLRLPSPAVLTAPVLPGIGDTWETPSTGSLAGRGPGVPGMSPRGTLQPTPGVVHREATVDDPPMLLTHPVLEYPALLRSAGLEGLVILEVIIDSTGVPEPESLRVIAASHRSFVAAAARVVLGARFRPGRMRGQPVRVLIRQPITFRLER